MGNGAFECMASVPLSLFGLQGVCCIQVEVKGDKISQDDQQMSQAIEASLNFELSNEGYEEVPLEERVRKGNW